MSYRKRVIKFYLHPLDDAAHQALKKILPQKAFVEVKDLRGRRVGMWECSLEMADLCQHEVPGQCKLSSLKVAVYEKMASDGRLRMRQGKLSRSTEVSTHPPGPGRPRRRKIDPDSLS